MIIGKVQDQDQLYKPTKFFGDSIVNTLLGPRRWEGLVLSIPR